MIFIPASVPELAALVRDQARVVPRGSGTKPRLSAGADCDAAVIQTTSLNRLLEYEPSEYTFTAEAGIRVSEVAETVRKQGQYLPFDPMLVECGATLGGMVAAGLSGPGRLRYGGIRDFILGVAFVDGTGTLVHGGGKVVKNAAGFDFPKLLTGSLGRLGIMTELTFKVFPAPEASLTARVSVPDAPAAVSLMAALNLHPFDLDALDYQPPNQITLRISGIAAAFPDRLAGLAKITGSGLQQLSAQEGDAFWGALVEWRWPRPGHWRIKAPITLPQIPALEALFASTPMQRRYSVGGNVAFLAWPETAGEAALRHLLQKCSLQALLLDGAGSNVFAGPDPEGPVRRLVQKALDPASKFLPFH